MALMCNRYAVDPDTLRGIGLLFGNILDEGSRAFDRKGAFVYNLRLTITPVSYTHLRAHET